MGVTLAFIVGTLAAVRWDNHYIEVTQGDALTLTCTVTDLRFLDVVRVSRKDASGTELPIADNLKVKPMFLSNIRLKVYFSFNQNGSATSVLQYKGWSWLILSVITLDSDFQIFETFGSLYLVYR